MYKSKDFEDFTANTMFATLYVAFFHVLEVSSNNEIECIGYGQERVSQIPMLRSDLETLRMQWVDTFSNNAKIMVERPGCLYNVHSIVHCNKFIYADTASPRRAASVTPRSHPISAVSAAHCPATDSNLRLSPISQKPPT